MVTIEGSKYLLRAFFCFRGNGVLLNDLQKMIVNQLLFVLTVIDYHGFVQSSLSKSFGVFWCVFLKWHLAPVPLFRNTGLEAMFTKSKLVLR